MKCPYTIKSETTIQNFGQKYNDEGNPKNSKSVTQTVYELMDCEKDNCGAWQNGKCCYSK